MTTDFSKVYNCFYSKITDDMYMEITEAETKAMSRELLLNAIPWFEFPRVNLNNYDYEKSCFNVQLSNEEINILAIYMMIAWIDQQLASIEVIRMKYSGSDFKFTSQANHMSKLLSIKKDYERVGLHLQRLYKRRKQDKDGVMRSTFGSIMANSVRGGGAPVISKEEYNGPTGEGWTDDPINPNPNPPSGGGDSWEDMTGSPPASGNDTWEDM